MSEQVLNRMQVGGDLYEIQDARIGTSEFSTLSDYGITDAKAEQVSGTNDYQITLGTTTVRTLTNSSELAANKVTGQLTNGVTATTQADNDNTTKVATTAFVQTAINNVLDSSKALTYEGTLETLAQFQALTSGTVGDTYVSNGTFTVQFTTGVDTIVRPGDMLICKTTYSGGFDATKWNPVSRGSGSVIGPTSAVNNHLAVFDGTTGDLIKDGGELPDLNAFILADDSGSAVDPNPINADTLNGHAASYFATTTDLAGKAPTSHASSATTYGTGTSSNYGHLKLSAATNSTSGASDGIAATPSAVKSAYDLASTANTAASSAQTTANAAMPKGGGTFTGVVTAQNNASYTTKQVRNITLSTSDPSGGSNGDIWIKYTN